MYSKKKIIKKTIAMSPLIIQITELQLQNKRKNSEYVVWEIFCFSFDNNLLDEINAYKYKMIIFWI